MKMKAAEKVIIAYLRDEKKNRNGVMVAGLIDGKVRLGYSACNTLKGDVFNRELGLKIANSRMTSPKVHVKKRLKASLEHFAERAKKYFQDKQTDYTIALFGE